MAIDEKDILLLENRGSIYLLLCGEDRYHLVKADAALTEARERKLMQKYPCSEQSMKELGIHFQTIMKSQLSRLQITGNEAGDQIILWQGNSRRIFTLEDDTTEEALAKIFVNITRVKAATKTKGNAVDAWRKKEQDPAVFKKMKMLRIGLVALNAIVLIAYWLRLPVDVLWGGACALFPIVYIVLAIKYPAYFTFLDILASKRNRGKTAHNGIGLGSMCMLSGAVLAFPVFSKNYLASFSVILVGLIVAVLITIAFWIWSKDARSKKSLLAAILLCFIFAGTGLVGTFNEVADNSAPQIKSYVVEDKHMRSGKRMSCRLEIRLEDGTEFELYVDYDTYQSIQPGDVIQVARREGGLGLAYLYYVED